MLFSSNYVRCPAATVVIHETMTSSVATPSHSASWLLSYKGKSAREVTLDPRFKQLLQPTLPHYTVNWYSSYGTDHPLPAGIPHALSGFADPVAVESNRFVVLSGAFGTEADLKGLLWVNTESEPPVTIFALMWQGVSKSSVDIYTNGSSPSTLLPPQFIYSLLNWEKQAGIKNVSLITVTTRRTISRSCRRLFSVDLDPMR